MNLYLIIILVIIINIIVGLYYSKSNLLAFSARAALPANAVKAGPIKLISNTNPGFGSYKPVSSNPTSSQNRVAAQAAIKPIINTLTTSSPPGPMLQSIVSNPAWANVKNKSAVIALYTGVPFSTVNKLTMGTMTRQNYAQLATTFFPGINMSNIVNA